MIRVLHVGTEKSWRGGENQIRQLIQNSPKELQHFVAYPRGSRAVPIFNELVPVCELPSTKSYDFRCPRKISEFCDDHRIDLIDAHSSVALGWALKVKNKMPKLKLVSHRRVAFPLKQNRWSRSKHLSADIDAYVAISNYIQKQLLTYGVPAEKVFAVPSAVAIPETQIEKNSARAEWLEKLGLAPKSPLFGVVGAMTPEKGQDLVIQAFAQLSEKASSAKLLLAGDGASKSSLEKLSAKLGLSDRVHFLGHIQDAQNLLRALDVLIVPSRQEGLGTIVLDAMLARTLVVASDAGGLPEMVIDGWTGLQFKSEHVAELRAKMQEALDRFASGELQENALQKVQKDFSLEKMVSGNLEVYRRVMESAF